MGKLEIRQKEGLKKIGAFKFNVDEFISEESYQEHWEKGDLYVDENGNMVPAVKLYIPPKGYWDDAGALLTYVLVVPEENVYEINIDQEQHDKWIVAYWEGKNDDVTEFDNEDDAWAFYCNMNEEAPYCGASEPERAD